MKLATLNQLISEFQLTLCNRCRKRKKQADVQALHVCHFCDSDVTVAALWQDWRAKCGKPLNLFTV
jgi:hypothetical protein